MNPTPADPADPADPGSLTPSPDESEILEIERRMPRAQDVESLTAAWAEDITYFDFGGQYSDRSAATREIRAQFGRVSDIRTEILDLTVMVNDGLAVAFSTQNFRGDGASGEVTLLFRKTDAYERRDGRWCLVHQHLSVPTDPTR